MEAVILAGGLGTRLRPAVADLPKPLAPVNGRPFLKYLLDYWTAQGVARAVLSVGYMHEAIERTIGNLHAGCPVSYAVEAEPLGTGGGLILAAAQLHGAGTFLGLNGDTMFAAPLARLAEFHRDTRADMTLALFATGDAVRYTGVATNAEGRVTALRGAGQANGGVYLIERRLVDELPWAAGAKVSLESEILPWLLADGRRLFGLRCDGGFIDIGVPEDYRRAQALMPAPH
jgi:D-glycero-alpha-D-manno-heptose 1-phosphate guanylyltransferase